MIIRKHQIISLQETNSLELRFKNDAKDLFIGIVPNTKRNFASWNTSKEIKIDQTILFDFLPNFSPKNEPKEYFLNKKQLMKLGFKFNDK